MNNLGSLLPALLFGLLALGIVLYVLSLVLAPLLGDPRRWLDRARIRRREQALAQAETALEQRDEARARQLLRSAFHLDLITHEAALVERVTSLNLTTLSRVISLAGSRTAALESVPLLEDLLQSRGQLLSMYVENLGVRSRVKDRRRGRSTATPEWAVNEFEKKLSEILERLATNRRTIESQLDTLFAALRELPTGGEITWH